MAYGPRRPHRVSDIATQAGLSPATVDRVLHERPGVSPRAVRQVERALAELDRQQGQLRLGARPLVVDLIMQAPDRFSAAVRDALESELVMVRPAAVRARFELHESAEVSELVDRLDAIDGPSGGHPAAPGSAIQTERRGAPERPRRARQKKRSTVRHSDGVLLKAPDHPAVAGAVDRLAGRGVPVITLVTDVSDCDRVAYIGLDNAAAGETAAYLVTSWLGAAPGAVLVTLSRTSMVGERQRLAAFERRCQELAPEREVLVLTDSDGLDFEVAARVRRLLVERDDIAAVYSAGGGNRALVAEFDAAGVRPLVHIAHDLDGDNVPLLLGGRIQAVLHHDLRADMRAALRQVLRHHRLLPGAPTSVAAAPQIVTRYNMPARLGAR